MELGSTRVQGMHESVVARPALRLQSAFSPLTFTLFLDDHTILTIVISQDKPVVELAQLTLSTLLIWRQP